RCPLHSPGETSCNESAGTGPPRSACGRDRIGVLNATGDLTGHPCDGLAQRVHHCVAVGPGCCAADSRLAGIDDVFSGAQDPVRPQLDVVGAAALEAEHIDGEVVARSAAVRLDGDLAGGQVRREVLAKRALERLIEWLCPALARRVDELVTD